MSRDEFVNQFKKLLELMGGASPVDVRPVKPVAPPARPKPIPSPPGAPSAPAAIVPGKSFTLLIGGEESLAMIWIEPGEFPMGSPADEAERAPYETLHTVRIKKGFWLGNTEVTQAQYQKLAGKNPSFFSGDHRSDLRSRHRFDRLVPAKP